MSRPRVYIVGAGIVSPLGTGLRATLDSLAAGKSGVAPLSLFPLLSGSPLPVGEIADFVDDGSGLPRSHQLALAAATQALAGVAEPPEALVIGTTTGGILTTESLLRNGVRDKTPYAHHGITTIAQTLARRFRCCGPVLTVSTACSSGVVALASAVAMLRRGEVKTVLAGGVDSLCRLTYFGFHSLQVVDPQGAHPLDEKRQGMSVAEGAALLLLSSEPGSAPLAEIAGVGLSCDAYHPVAPHPKGSGAASAMADALADGGLTAADIDYINLHGTGTRENDKAEARAVRQLFSAPPPLSSIKGDTGHGLAASGAIEAVVAALAVNHGLLPANTGLRQVDPDLGLSPLTAPEQRPVRAVLSSSFGFGGNNGSVVVVEPDLWPLPAKKQHGPELVVRGYAALSGLGGTSATLSALLKGESVAGQSDLATLGANLPPALIRRLKRLPQMALSLAVAAGQDAGLAEEGAVNAIFMGTGWGAMSETYDFLHGLTESAEKFPSPMDFVGSVHNGPASQIALHLKATGANITSSGGDSSFEQALFTAHLCLGDDETALVLGADEGHEILSPLLDGSIAAASPLADGGGAFCLGREKAAGRCLLEMIACLEDVDGDAAHLLAGKVAGRRYDLCLVGIPAACRAQGEGQLAILRQSLPQLPPLLDYRPLCGEFASSSALAAVLACHLLEPDTPPLVLPETGERLPDCQRVLLLGLGSSLTALEFRRL